MLAKKRGLAAAPIVLQDRLAVWKGNTPLPLPLSVVPEGLWGVLEWHGQK
jgi:hypothetical protein